MMSSACVSLRPQQLKPQTHGAAIGHQMQLTATSATTVTMSPKPQRNQSGSVHQKTKNPRTVPGSAKRRARRVNLEDMSLLSKAENCKQPAGFAGL